MPRHPGNEQVTPKAYYKTSVTLSFPSLHSQLLPMLVIGCLLPVAAMAQTAAELDWRDSDQLTPEQQELMPENCCGMYVVPTPEPLPEYLSERQPAGNEGEQPVLLQANNFDYDDSGIVNMQGNVRAIQQNSQVTGESGRYNRNTGMAHMEGNIRVRQPGLLMTGATVDVNQQSGEMELAEASYLLHQQQIRGTADSINYTDGNGIVTIDNGRFTRCEPASNDWRIQASEIVLNQDTGRGTAWHMTLRIADIPVLYTPWMTFPINDERQSGFLAPSIGSTNDGGLDLELPYYFNLAPNYDATYTPRYMSDRGLHHGLELRHMNSWSDQEINLGYLGSDDLYDAQERALIDDAIDNNTPLPDDVESPPVEKRWAVSLNHRGRFAERWTSLIDYANFSDIEYLDDFSTNGIQSTAQSYVTRTGQVRYSGNIWQMTGRLRSYQVLDPTINELNAPEELLPQIFLDGSYSDNLNINYDLHMDYTYFDRNLELDDFGQAVIDSGRLATGGRFLFEPEASYTWSTPGTFITPSLRYYYAQYDLEEQTINADPKPSRGLWSASIDSGLIFERPVSFFGSDFMQTLEPQLFYLYTEYEDQSEIPEFDSADPTFSFNQLFRPNRFTGSDRIGDANQITLALSSRLLDEDGREKARVRIGQIFYFEDRQVSLDTRPSLREENDTADTSPLVAELDYRLSNDWRLNSSIVWDSNNDMVEQGAVQFQYQSGRDKILNIGMRYRDEDRPLTTDGYDRRIIQSDVSIAWPLTDSWDIVAKHSYDFANGRKLETLAGLEYDSCCWRTRVVYREWVENNWNTRTVNLNYDYGLFLQFELKGLGSILGGSVGEMLADSIHGYRLQ